MPHRPSEVVADIVDKLNARARHIVFLLGAGASCAGNLPTLAGLQQLVSDALVDESRARFDALGAGRNLEEILTRLRVIHEAVRGTAQALDDGLDAATSRALDAQICAKVATILTSTNVNLQHHERFAQWIGLSQYDRPIEIATTNYDLLIERGLELAGIPYFDGFAGMFEGSFRSDLVDDDIADAGVRVPIKWPRVWKLHGSVCWTMTNRGGQHTIVRRGTMKIEDPNSVVVIYPSFEKYQESRRLPFVAFADRLRRAVAMAETLVVTCGYSFGDQHINELLFDAARYFPRSEVTALFFADIPANVVAAATALPNLTALGATQAIIGRQADAWEAPAAPEDWWTADRFTLGDFRTLAALLARRIPAPIPPAPIVASSAVAP